MQIQNLDGIRRKKIISFVQTPTLVNIPTGTRVKKHLKFTYVPGSVSRLVVILSLFLGFIFSLVTVSFIPKTVAEKSAEYPKLLEINFEDSDFNIQLKNLADFFEKKNQPDQTAQRAERIKKFLQGKTSPFADLSDLLARQEHWKIILAISNAESTLGRNCFNKNCSGIGVKPGHPAWREYETLRHWVVDFNSLLERKYKNWTLKEMCGVYVQPCNKNWLSATRQILMEIQEMETNN